ncbi:MAG: hypothetical protein CMP91_11465 [Gammaproteobacteria bacterium]|nr:hypothetical protein [Gammaproteobacteria bacterium]MAY03407.1 hypothetical protein [Gammaproteobacteria bacterium]|tara:strand:- start:715 stop:1797 length:1083 start_codon:yes stop_codon:yes gene_type:complete
MKLFKTVSFFLLGSIMLIPSQAQEIIRLNDTDIATLGIMLSPVRNIDNSIGDSFPATVVNSPMTTSMLNIPYAGIIQSWLVEPGQSVEQGDALVIIQSQELLGLQNEWNAARYELEQFQFEMEKDRILLDQGIISMQRLRQTQRNFQQAQSALQILESRLALAGFTTESLVALEQDNAQAGSYTLRSPAQGTVDHLMYSVGSYAESNTPIASIGSQQRWISAEIPARAATRLSPGQVLRLQGGNTPLTLRQKDSEIDTQSQTVGILASFNATTDYMVGQVVTLIIPPDENGVHIPGDAVIHNGNDTVVYVRNAEGFEVRSLQLRPAGADYVAASGIIPGEQVVIRGGAILKGIQLGLGGE